MDELELLKRDWKKKEGSFNQITEKEIYGMLHKRSSSIVKWILIISILEIIFWSLLNFFTSDENYSKTLEMYHIKTFSTVVNSINYLVIFYFIYLFYNNFKKINTTDSVKGLMQNIIKTRKTVKYYVWFNLFMFFVGLVVVLVAQFFYDPNITHFIENLKTKNINENNLYAIIVVIYIFIVGISIFIFWLFYKLLYGILLKRLNNNYKELEKMDL